VSENFYKPTLLKRAIAEFLGTAFLLSIIVGSGIMGERLAGGNTAVALLGNTLSIGAGLLFLILTFAPISGAHFNPVVTLAAAWQKGLNGRESLVYMLMQICGAFAGTAAANLMFALPAVVIANKTRNGNGLILGEFIATFGLLAVIQATVKFRPPITPFAVAAYVTSAIWFTSSTAFANPAVTLARTVSDTFTGIRPVETPPFIIAQLAGTVASMLLFRWLLRDEKTGEIVNEQ
jgi:glycerol uptake facilitator-like aquaporin